ncbi:MAG: YggT family protein [Parachlamydiales bacterium]|jgi:uncharacterized protein YggT (Ycf19 family)
MFAHIIKILFTCYNFFLIARVLGSWIPQFQNHNLMRFISYYTEPYLKIFRRLIPMIGGALDLSPLVGLLVLQLFEKFILHFIR